MAKSELTFDQLILEKRNTDPQAPASGKFALYNKNGAIYAKDENNSIASLSNTAQSLVYLSSPNLANNIAGQWDFNLLPGYKMMRFQLWLQTATAVNRILYFRLDDHAAANDYSLVGQNHGGNYSLGTAEIRAGSVSTNAYARPYTFVTLDVWDYADPSRNTVLIYNSTLLEPAARANYIGTGIRLLAESNNELNVTMNADNFGACSAAIWGLKEA